MEQLVRDLLQSAPVARIDLTKTSVVAGLLYSLRAVGVETEVSALLARDPTAYADHYRGSHYRGSHLSQPSALSPATTPEERVPMA